MLVEAKLLGILLRPQTTTQQLDTWRKRSCVIIERVRNKRGRLYFHCRVIAPISHTVDLSVKHFKRPLKPHSQEHRQRPLCYANTMNTTQCPNTTCKDALQMAAFMFFLYFCPEEK